MGNVRDQTGRTIPVLMVAGLVTATIGTAGMVGLARMQTNQAKKAVTYVAEAHDVQAEAALHQALTAAQVYYSENGTFVGFAPDIASNYDPNVTYNVMPTAVADQISIRMPGQTSVALATRSQSGGVLCIGVNEDLVTYGRVDAPNAPACTGDWGDE